MKDNKELNSFISRSSSLNASNTGIHQFGLSHQNVERGYETNESQPTSNSSLETTSLDNSNWAKKDPFIQASEVLESILNDLWYYKYQEASDKLDDFCLYSSNFINAPGNQGLQIFHKKGLIHYKMYQYEDTLNSLRVAKRCSQKTVINVQNATDFRCIYTMIADIFIQYGDYEKGWKYLNKALDLVQRFFKDALSEKIPIYTIKAEILYMERSSDDGSELHVEDCKNARVLLKEVLHERKQNGQDMMIGFTYLEMTQMYIEWAKRDRRKLEKAITRLYKGYICSRKNRATENYFMIARHWRNGGQIWLLLGEIHEAREAYDHAIKGIDDSLPSKNFFSRQYRDEYRFYFGVEYRRPADIYSVI